MPNPMSLTHALLQSNLGIAKRQQLIRRTKSGKQIFEFWFALASQKGKVFICNGRTGAVKKMFTVDQLRNDWRPVMFEPPEDFRIVVAGPDGKVEGKGKIQTGPGRKVGFRKKKPEEPAIPEPTIQSVEAQSLDPSDPPGD